MLVMLVSVLCASQALGCLEVPAELGGRFVCFCFAGFDGEAGGGSVVAVAGSVGAAAGVVFVAGCLVESSCCGWSWRPGKFVSALGSSDQSSRAANAATMSPALTARSIAAATVSVSSGEHESPQVASLRVSRVSTGAAWPPSARRVTLLATYFGSPLIESRYWRAARFGICVRCWSVTACSLR